MSLLKSTRHQNKKLRDSCKGKPCQLMLAPQCSGPETTQPAHVQLRRHGGTGTKPSDLFLVDACDNCHAILDGRIKSDISREFIELTAFRAMYKKQQFFLDAGLVSLGVELQNDYIPVKDLEELARAFGNSEDCCLECAGLELSKKLKKLGWGFKTE